MDKKAIEEIKQDANSIRDVLIALRRNIHSFAEVGFELPKTVELVKNRLNEIGLVPQDCGRSGVVATVGKGERCILLRADMDALPICEEACVDFKAENGNMHACGHDMHTAMLLGAAEILKKHEAELSCTVKLVFQPAEEILEGAKNMIENGILENPVPDAAMMIHVISVKETACGVAIVSGPGVVAPAAEYFEITLKGKGGHGSSPAECVDSLTAAARVVLGLEEIPARELLVDEDAVLTVGMLNAGVAANVIADVAIINGTMRAYDEEVCEKIKNRIIEITRGISDAYRVEGEVKFTHSCPTLINDSSLTDAIYECASELLGEDKVIKTQGRGGGSEDFAYISHRVPSVMLTVSASDGEYPLHHPKISFDESVLSVGAALYAYAAMELLKNKGADTPRMA